jgi:hypothetical protein
LQTLLLPGMSVAAPTPSSDGCLYIASSSDKGIRQLRPVPLERQAKLLAAAGDFQGALELLTLMEDEEVTPAAAAGGSEEGSEEAGKSITAAAAAAAVKRQQLEDVLRLRFGYHLFEGAFCGSHACSQNCQQLLHCMLSACMSAAAAAAAACFRLLMRCIADQRSCHRKLLRGVSCC